MITAGLHLYKGAGAAFQPLHQMACGFSHRHDVIDQCLGAIQIQQEAGLEGLDLHLFRIADDACNLRHGGEHVRVDLRGATGHDDRNVRLLATGPADGLAGLSYSFIGDGAGIHNDRIRQTSLGGIGPHDLAFIAVQSASQCQDVDMSAIVRLVWLVGHGG